jgi:fructose-1,6-bisphosphatase II
MRGVVVIGEGEKDEAPMLYNGESVGDGTGPRSTSPSTPSTGTTLTAKSLPNALAIVAVAERHTMFDPGPCVYMEKLAVAGRPRRRRRPHRPVETNLQRIAAKARGGRGGADRLHPRPPAPRRGWSSGSAQAGARIKFLLDGDVAGAISAAEPETGVDLLVGIGGTPEGVLAACALKCLGGAFFGRLYPRDDDERRRAVEAGYDLDKVLTTDDMVRSDNVFVAATGVTDGELLHGVRFGADRATTHSLSMRSLSGAVRLIETRHRISTSNLSGSYLRSTRAPSSG